MDISQDKTEMGIFVCSLCAEGGSFFEYLHTYPLPTACPLQSRGTHEHKAYWLSELCVLGAHLSNGSFKSWGAKCGVQTLCSREKLGILSSHLIVQCYATDGVYDKHVPQPFLPVLSNVWELLS